MADVMTAPAGTKASTGALMEVRGLEAWYGESHVLHGVDIDIREGEVVTLRPQWRRQDLHLAFHHGAGATPHRFGEV